MGVKTKYINRKTLEIVDRPGKNVMKVELQPGDSLGHINKQNGHCVVQLIRPARTPESRFGKEALGLVEKARKESPQLFRLLELTFPQIKDVVEAAAE
jgi:hypothetical protein